MSTLTWIARSCFSVCWLPLGDPKLTSSPQWTMKNMTFDKKNKKGFTGICNNNLSGPSNKCNSKGQLNNPVTKEKDGGVPITGNKIDHSSWSLFTDEDYIVFCFEKDLSQGDKGINSDALIKGVNVEHKNSKPGNLEMKYDEGEQGSDLNLHEKRSNANQRHNDQDCVTLSNKEVQSHYHDLSLQEEEIMTRTCHLQEIEGQAESSNYDQPEGSRSSFAFPVLGWEWIGSPVQMPKSEGLHLRKHKARALRFQCCRF